MGFRDGPLKGFRNGERSFKMEIKPGINIGTYHVLDNQKVLVRYPGQLQTGVMRHPGHVRVVVWLRGARKKVVEKLS